MIYRVRPNRGLLPDEIPVKKSELARLQRAEHAHRRYYEGVRILGAGAEKMRAEAAGGSEYAQGWIACLRLLALTISRQEGGHDHRA